MRELLIKLREETIDKIDDCEQNGELGLYHELCKKLEAIDAMLNIFDEEKQREINNNNPYMQALNMFCNPERREVEQRPYRIKGIAYCFATNGNSLIVVPEREELKQLPEYDFATTLAEILLRTTITNSQYHKIRNLENYVQEDKFYVLPKQSTYCYYGKELNKVFKAINVLNSIREGNLLVKATTSLTGEVIFSLTDLNIYMMIMGRQLNDNEDCSVLFIDRV